MKKMGVISRKGISAVVAVVLLLLIVVAAIVILWSVVIPLVKTNVQQVSSISEMTDFSIVEGGYTAYFPEKERAIVQIKSGPDNSTAVELQVMFYINGESVEYRIPPPKRDDTLPMSNEARVYWFNLSGMGVPDKVSVAPVYRR